MQTYKYCISCETPGAQFPLQTATAKKKKKIRFILGCMFVTLPPRPDHAVMLSVSRKPYGSPAKQVRQNNLVISIVLNSFPSYIYDLLTGGTKFCQDHFV